MKKYLEEKKLFNTIVLDPIDFLKLVIKSILLPLAFFIPTMTFFINVSYTTPTVWLTGLIIYFFALFTGLITKFYYSNTASFKKINLNIYSTINAVITGLITAIILIVVVILFSLYKGVI